MIVSAKLKQQIKDLPELPGVYIFKDAAKVILYIGKSVRLRDRVKSYFADSNQLGTKTKHMVEKIVSLEYIRTDSEIEALLLEADLIKQHRPQYNIQWKDDKRYKYIKVQNAKFRQRNGIKRTVEQGLWPAIYSIRQIDDKKSLYFGPFPEGQTVSQVLRLLRRIFPWCQYRNRMQLDRAKKPCFNAHLNQCPGICAQAVDLASYWRDFDQLLLFLQGRKLELVKKTEARMKTLAAVQRFEEAAYFRDRLEKLTYITQQFHRADEYLGNVNLLEDVRQEEVQELIDVLGLPQPDELSEFRIEGYDISNLGDEYTVGSRVSFLGGDPNKTEYRRYRISRNKLPNDFAALQEVLRRRVKRLNDLPDLVLIDGGVGQLRSVQKVLREYGVQIAVIGLAKKFETIIIPDANGGYRHKRLPVHSPARKLLQRVRDESHRFAGRYHRYLRKRALLEGKS